MFLSMFTVSSDVPSNTLADAGADCKAKHCQSNNTVELEVPHKGNKL